MHPSVKHVARRHLRAQSSDPDAYSVFGDYLEPWPEPLADSLPIDTQVVVEIDGRPYSGYIVAREVIDNDVARYEVRLIIDGDGYRAWVKVAKVYLSTSEVPHG